jgi:uncharacterized membrane protein
MNPHDHLAEYEPAHTVGTKERIVSGIAGAWLLRSALTSGISIGGFLKGAAGAYLVYRAASGNCPVYNALERSDELKARNITIKARIIVNKPRLDVYAFWRKLEQLPLFMTHLVSVEQARDGQSRWIAKFPGVPKPVEWYATIIRDEPGSLLSWAAMYGSDIDNAGNVEFRDTASGETEVSAVITYRAPMGLAGEGVARLLNPLLEGIVKDDLHNFKKVMENTTVAPVV